MIVSQSKISIWHILSIIVFCIYLFEIFFRLFKNENGITKNIINSFKKTKGRDYIYIISILGFLTTDLYFNKNLTGREIRDIKTTIKLSLLASITALFAHLDTYVVPGMFAIGLQILI